MRLVLEPKDEGINGWWAVLVVVCFTLAFAAVLVLVP